MFLLAIRCQPTRPVLSLIDRTPQSFKQPLRPLLAGHPEPYAYSFSGAPKETGSPEYLWFGKVGKIRSQMLRVGPRWPRDQMCSTMEHCNASMML